MPRAKTTQNLLGLVDSDSDDDLFASFATDVGSSALKKKTMPPKKTTGRAAANKVTKPPTKTATRRANDKVAAAVEAAIEKEPDAVAPAPRRGRRAAADKLAETEVLATPPTSEPVAKPKATRGRPKATVAGKGSDQEEDTIEIVPKPVVTGPAKRGRKPAARTQELELEVSPEIPETQAQDAMDVDEEEVGATTLGDLTVISPDGSPPGRAVRLSMSSPLKIRSKTSASKEAEESDSTLRRRLGDLTKKHDALETKYRELREIGVKEAERNFDRFKKQTEDKAKSANDLIAKLKEELATQRALAKEAETYKKELDVMQKEAASLESEVSALEEALGEARQEIKTLATKLAASRAVEIPSLKRPPGSALKAGSGAVSAAARAAANAEAMQAAQAAQMKEDLYGDLTGLIVRGVKRSENEDVFDCIQTGRNGTLHFKLSIGNDTMAENYDEVQFMYMPQLDPGRDRALMEMLPDYLVEEISFPRPHAAKFYSRVMRSLTERIE